jgi:molybdopterin-guanine dinucleotide biosynthesis protein A
LLPAVIDELNKGRRSLQNVLETARVVSLDVNPEEERLLMNLNTPGDYDHLLNQN